MFTRIQPSDLSGKGVIGQNSVPGLSVLEMQQSVEQVVREVAIPAVNRLADELEQSAASQSIGAEMPAGAGEGNTVQQALDGLGTRLGEHIVQSDNPHGVTALQTGAYTKAETEAAIDRKIVEIGAGDMSKAVYGGSADGVVRDSDRLNGHNAQWLMPTGLIAPFGGSAAPAGWLLCDGSVVSRAEYPDLFSVIGTVYGSGDGSSTFQLPDFRGRTAVGVDLGHSSGVRRGEETHTLTETELAPHRHASAGYLYTNQLNCAGGSSLGLAYSDTLYTTYTGGGQPHNNMQPSLYVHYIIKI